VFYLIGSIPFGLILTRLAGLGDIRTIGSGNIGATNVLRTGNKKLAALTLFLDGFKGYLAVMLAFQYADEWHCWPCVAALCAVLGHNFPVWLKFKGGKGVATTLGVMLAINWVLGLVIAATWLVTFFFTRVSSLSALVSAVLAPVYAYFLADIPLTILTSILSCMLIYRHKANISRILKGEEGAFWR
ncbi:MAG: glycerol-3-phosphate 1-O-acyltransferase PlsY, partial [Alphaproteobacteria bacterium]|nr:glycerol-3-phosphate 1-O-acyltransferase PlsY [Alphaproteobacteria bacterium]